MAWKANFIILAIVFCGIISTGGLFADAAAVPQAHDADIEKRNINPADPIDDDFGIDPNAGGDKPGTDKKPETIPMPDDNDDTTDIPDTTPSDNRPPDTVNPPRKITFGYRTNVDLDVNGIPAEVDIDIEVGSQEDEEASQWLVVTADGFEYDGSPDVLREIFAEANSSFAGSIDDMIAEYGEPTVDDVSAAGPSFDVRSKRTVFSLDTRRRVYNPRYNFPWAAMGRVDVGCTGTFIGPRHILTAGHCVFDRRTLRWESNLNFRRGKDCDPNRGSYYVWRQAVAPLGWTRNGLRAYNYGMIVVDRVSPTYMNFGWNLLLYRFVANIAGYPIDKTYPGRGCLWHTSCTTRYHFTDRFGYKCDTYHGMGGGPVYLYLSATNTRIIYCIHAYEGTIYNSCTRITRTKFGGLQRWIRDY